MTEQKPTLAASLRMLADLADANPEMEEWYRFPGFGQHLIGDGAAGLDRFAEVFGAPVKHDDHDNPDTGKRYSTVESHVGRLDVRLQCTTADYEKATGKTVEQATTSQGETK